MHCAAKGWLIASTDIRNAFILAPIKDEEDDEDEVYALYAPKVFQLARVQYALRLWRVDRALKGFRRQGYGGPEVEVSFHSAWGGKVISSTTQGRRECVVNCQSPS